MAWGKKAELTGKTQRLILCGTVLVHMSVRRRIIITSNDFVAISDLDTGLYMDKGQGLQRRGGILDAAEEFIHCYGNRYILATDAWYIVDMQSLRP